VGLGILGYNGQGTKPGDIKDGASNSLMVAEKRLNFTLASQYQYQAGEDDAGYTAGFGFNTARYTQDPNPPAGQPPAGWPPQQDPVGNASPSGGIFGSIHKGSMNAALCDGSVRKISYSIFPDTFKAVGTISQGEIVGNDFNQ
jgi:prepilin-type processing-associated H-X9-DG protein